MVNQKIFCIGFHKTGTSSIAEALRLLGYSVTGPNETKNTKIGKEVIEIVRRLVPKYDAFQDNPWPIIYKEMDELYPSSKFILTVRDSDSWLRSIVNHFGDSTTPMREWIYGVGAPRGNEKIYQARYTEHNISVQEYFKNREDDLLILDFAKGDGWATLCPFLGDKMPAFNFPHANKASIRKGKQPITTRLVRHIREKRARLKKLL